MKKKKKNISNENGFLIRHRESQQEVACDVCCAKEKELLTSIQYLA